MNAGLDAPAAVSSTVSSSPPTDVNPHAGVAAHVSGVVTAMKTTPPAGPQASCALHGMLHAWALSGH